MFKPFFSSNYCCAITPVLVISIDVSGSEKPPETLSVKYCVKIIVIKRASKSPVLKIGSPLFSRQQYLLTKARAALFEKKWCIVLSDLYLIFLKHTHHPILSCASCDCARTGSFHLPVSKGLHMNRIDRPSWAFVLIMVSH